MDTRHDTNESVVVGVGVGGQGQLVSSGHNYGEIWKILELEQSQGGE